MVRAKYPSAYDDLSDVALEAQVKAKFPGVYDDLPSSSATGAHPEAKMSAGAHVLGVPQQTLPADAVDENGQKRLVSPKVAQFMTTPLARPTGIDAVDSFLSPSSLALMAAQGGMAAATAARSAVTNLTDTVGEKLAGKLLKFVMPSMLKKPAEAASILSDIVEAYKSQGKPAGGAAPASPVTVAPAASSAPPAAAPQTASAPPMPAQAQSAPVAAPAPAPATPAGVPMSRPAAMQAALKAFSEAQETPRPAEVSNTASLIAKGTAPEQALKVVLGNRAPMTPAEEFAAKMGTPNDAAMTADMRNRYQRGQKSLRAYGKD
jgi:hypothetical protein